MTVQEIETFVKEAGTEISKDFCGTVLGGIHCQQIPDEISRCIKYLMDNAAIKSYLEVGAAAGGTTYLVNHFLKPEMIVVIDDNQHPNSHKRQETLQGIRRVEIIGHSGAGKTTETLEQIMRGEQFDLVFIDADHTYANCKRDTMLYKQYLKVGGYLLFHDSALDYCGVKRVVWETKQDDRMEFIEEFASLDNPPLGLALFRRLA